MGAHRTNSAQEQTGITPTHSARYPWACAWCLSQAAVRTPFPLRGNEEEARHIAWQAKPDHILALVTQTLGELTGSQSSTQVGPGSSFEVRMGAHL